MRLLVVLLLLVTAACRQEETSAETPASPEMSAVEVYASGPRDRLCLKPGEQRVGVITYAASGDGNCALRGTVTGTNLIKPDGDGSCAILFERNGDRIVLKGGGYSCRYYCGPGASLEGKSFSKVDGEAAATDLAGDPLC